jgi:hypothetical protein
VPSDDSRVFRLTDQEDPAAGIRRVARGRLETAGERLAEAADGANLADSIHAARKDLKKVRAVLRLVRDELGTGRYRRQNQRYRDAGRLLSVSRDAEVKVTTLAILEELPAEDGVAGAIRDWRVELEGERDRLASLGEGRLGGDIEVVRSVLERGIWDVEEWRFAHDSWRLLEPGLTRSYRRARRQMQRAQEQPSTSTVHEWRKRVKDLWYQLRIVERAWPPVLEPTTEQAHRLAEVLGEDHDLALLVEDLHSRRLERREGLETLLEARRSELLRRGFNMGQRLLAERPRAFAARLEAYWSAWRA